MSKKIIVFLLLSAEMHGTIVSFILCTILLGCYCLEPTLVSDTFYSEIEQNSNVLVLFTRLTPLSLLKKEYYD